MNILIKKNDRVEVEVFAWEEGETMMASTAQADVPKGADAQILKFFFRKPNYQDSQNIIRASQVKVNETITLDAVTFQENVFRSLLVDWDLKNEGEAIPFNVTNVNALSPAVARAAVLGALDKLNI
jgi:hypothetical protein